MNLLKIPTFSAARVFHVVVESPRGSALKLKYDPRWEVMTVSRPLALGQSERIRNDRILAVPEAARRERDVETIDQLASRLKEELEQFTIASTALEGKDVRIVGWGDPRTALALIEDMTSARR